MQGETLGFWNLKANSQWHPSSNRVIYLCPSTIVSQMMTKHTGTWAYWCCSHSNHYPQEDRTLCFHVTFFLRFRRSTIHISCFDLNCTSRLFPFLILFSPIDIIFQREKRWVQTSNTEVVTVPRKCIRLCLIFQRQSSKKLKKYFEYWLHCKQDF